MNERKNIEVTNAEIIVTTNKQIQLWRMNERTNKGMKVWMNNLFVTQLYTTTQTFTERII